MTIETGKLDNPVWYALSETHKDYALDYNGIKFYHPDYCPFGGWESGENVAAGITRYGELTDNFFVVGQKPEIPASFQLKNDLVCDQMIIRENISLSITETIVPLGDELADDLFQLVNLVQPGYFRPKTSLLGNYFGIFNNDQLIAVTGERMQLDDMVEVSAVVTHPDHTGKGYAKQLVAHTVNNILLRGKLPFLHVAETNIGAISLYEKLGFHTRRKISFWNIENKTTWFIHFFEELYTNFNERKTELVLANLSANVKWANGWEGGYEYGPDAVSAYWTRQFKQISANVTPVKIEVLADEVRIRVQQVVHDIDGKLLADQEVTHHFTLDGNKITKFDILPDI